MSQRLSSLALGTVAAVLLGAAVPPPPLVRTQDGPVQGRTSDGVRAFTGIPFAAPPVGPLRFRAPQPVTPWTRTLVADRPIPNCIQFGGLNGTSRGSQNGATEDCLYLSVWTPVDASPAKPLPVMFWIHGSGFSAGGAQSFDGAALARQGVVVVTASYRLGLMAHMVHPGLDAPGELSGNYNIRDNQAGLRWVQRNIRGFGGDPGNVTLFGQSAGGLSVMLNVVSPSAKGLFRKAIGQSTHAGAATERAAIDNRAQVEAGQSQQVVEKVGCKGRPDVGACLRAAPWQAFVDANIFISHVDDPALLPPDMHEALKAGTFNRVPLMLGNTNLEGAFYVSVSGRKLGHPIAEADMAGEAREFFGDAAPAMIAHYSAEKYGSPERRLMYALSDYRLACALDSTRLATIPWVPVWSYEMTEPAPEQKPLDPRYTAMPNVARHGSDVNYIFGGGAGGPFRTARAQQLSATFQRYWVNFARYSTPDPSGREWPRFTAGNQAVLNLEVPPKLSTDFVARHQCGFMRENRFVAY